MADLRMLGLRTLVLGALLAMVSPGLVTGAEPSRLDSGSNSDSIISAVDSNTVKGGGQGKPILKFSEAVKGASTGREIGAGVFYHRLAFKDMIAHVVSLSLNNPAYRVTPVVAESRKETSALSLDSQALAGINGGYFNLTDGVSASFVSVDGKQVLNPELNRALVDNPRLKPFLSRIFNRNELRIYKFAKSGAKDVELRAAVKAHSDPMPEGAVLVSSIQGGPALLPKLTAEKGAFIRRQKSGKRTDSIGTGRKAARTALGLTVDGGIALVVVEGSRGKEFTTGATLKTLAQFFKEIGCVEALNLDGGTSTTMVVRDQSGTLLKLQGKGKGARSARDGYSILFASETERKVKSILAIVPRS